MYYFVHSTRLDKGLIYMETQRMLRRVLIALREKNDMRLYILNYCDSFNPWRMPNMWFGVFELVQER